MLDTEIPKKNKASFEKLVKLIRQRNYKKATEYTYLRYNLDFLLFADKPAEKVVTKDIEKYIEHLKKEKCLHQRYRLISARSKCSLKKS